MNCTHAFHSILSGFSCDCCRFLFCLSYFFIRYSCVCFNVGCLKCAVAFYFAYWSMVVDSFFRSLSFSCCLIFVKRTTIFICACVWECVFCVERIVAILLDDNRRTLYCSWSVRLAFGTHFLCYWPDSQGYLFMRTNEVNFCDAWLRASQTDFEFAIHCALCVNGILPTTRNAKRIFCHYWSKGRCQNKDPCTVTYLYSITVNGAIKFVFSFILTANKINECDK